MKQERSPFQTYVAAVLAVMLTATFCVAVALDIPVPETFVNFLYVTVGGAIVGGATQWQPRR